MNNSGVQEIVDMMAEYRTVPELILSGLHNDGSWTLEVSKVGGGTLGRSYPRGEHWIVNSYVNHELVESVVIEPMEASRHIDVINAFARHWFGV